MQTNLSLDGKTLEKKFDLRLWEQVSLSEGEQIRTIEIG